MLSIYCKAVSFLHAWAHCAHDKWHGPTDLEVRAYAVPPSSGQSVHCDLSRKEINVNSQAVISRKTSGCCNKAFIDILSCTATSKDSKSFTWDPFIAYLSSHSWSFTHKSIKARKRADIPDTVVRARAESLPGAQYAQKMAPVAMCILIKALPQRSRTRQIWMDWSN